MESYDRQVVGAVRDGGHAGVPGNEPSAVSRFEATAVLPVAADCGAQVGDGADEVPDLDGLPAGSGSAAVGVPGQYRADPEEYRREDEGLGRVGGGGDGREGGVREAVD